jgi:hypothetical protein
VAKVLVSVEDGLLKRIDREAKARGLTRTAYLSQLAEGDIEMGHGRQRAAAQAALQELDEVFARSPEDDSTAAVRAARDGR